MLSQMENLKRGSDSRMNNVIEERNNWGDHMVLELNDLKQENTQLRDLLDRNQ